MTRSIPTLAALVVAVPLAAQAPGEHNGHAQQQLGRVRFATSCRGAAGTEVERGVAYLHSFWYEKAAETFTAAAARDSGCAMAFWGQAMSLLHPLWTPPSSIDARAALGAIARGLARATTTRERGYLDAIRAYYADYDRTDSKARLVRYALAMDAELAGDMATAVARYREFLSLMANADGARPELAIARRAVASR